MTNEKFEELRILCEQSSQLKTCCRNDSESNMPCIQANCPYIQFFNDLNYEERRRNSERSSQKNNRQA